MLSMKLILKPVLENYPELLLPEDLKFPVILGRDPFTQIRDSYCSRKQVSLDPDFKSKTVKVKQLGRGDSWVNEWFLGLGNERVAKDGDSINLVATIVSNKIIVFKYIVSFVEVMESNVGKKREREESQSQEDKKGIKIPKIFDFRQSKTKGKWIFVKKESVWVYMSDPDLKSFKSQLVGFDLDGTIITTKSGRVFPKDSQDWKFLYPDTASKIQTYYNAAPQDRKVVIFTNQGGLNKPKSDLDGFKKKIEAIVSALEVPVIVFMALDKNEFRKPVKGSFDLFVKEYNEKKNPDLNASWYCGDAAGRAKDHSKVDRLFALNIGLPFKTPQQFFEGSNKKEKMEQPVFIPKDYVKSTGKSKNDHVKFPATQEMIIMVGCPGSGKSTFCQKKVPENNYVHINRDKLKTPAKCIKVTTEALSKGSSVVIDNLNATKKDRATFINLAKEKKVPVRCFHLMTTLEHSMHNNKFRHLMKKPSVPDLVFFTFRKKFEEPTESEGFTEVLQVYFVPDFKKEENDLYCQFLLEK